MANRQWRGGDAIRCVVRLVAMSIGRTSLLLAPLAVGARAVAFFVPVAIARWYGV